jgi:hypothetical protein
VASLYGGASIVLMTVLDPDKDILDKPDRRERRAGIALVFTAFAGALVAAWLVYEIIRRGFAWPNRASFDGAMVLIIGIAFWLFVRLSKRR